LQTIAENIKTGLKIAAEEHIQTRNVALLMATKKVMSMVVIFLAKHFMLMSHRLFCSMTY
jgi:hypothetical protein